MKIRLDSRRRIVFIGLVVTGLLAARLVVGRESNVASRASPSAPSSTRSASNGQATDPAKQQPRDLDLALLSRPMAQEIEEHLFSVPAPPPAPAPPARPAQAADTPPKPMAPPLPFKFLGRMVDRGVTTTFVAYGGQNLGIKEGDEVERLYRVEQIADTQLVFVYLPLQEKQTLPTGGRP